GLNHRNAPVELLERMAVPGPSLPKALHALVAREHLAEAVLRAHDIPVLRKGPEAGIFGHGFAGVTAGGVELLVPEDRVADAHALLTAPETA
ncbi:MAG TPA: hypothetical protein PKE51_02885, partial [Gemmatimonadaceae bacterium]|nr:hypothetical protein [Gemmatimonadaceae bacterium]